MKRCPECGFRANDTTCPLCGVRMTGYTAPVQTHTHKQTGEKCVLPNQRPAAERESHKTERSGSRRRNGTTPSSLVTTIIVIVLISMLRSCMG